MPVQTNLDELLKNINDIQNGTFSTRPKVEEYEGPVTVIGAEKHISKTSGKMSIQLSLQTPEGAEFRTWLTLSEKNNIIKKTVVQLGALLQKAGADIKTVEAANADNIDGDKDRCIVYAQNLSNKIDKGAKVNIFASRKKTDNGQYSVNIAFLPFTKTIDDVAPVEDMVD